MKGRFNSLDTIAVRIELQKIVNARVNQIYDIDNKTYLIKLNAPDTSKVTLLFESGIRIHTTQRDWPKNDTPSGFTMKLRKHIRNKRIIKVEQLGVDRILDIQFGSGEAAYHLILELFNRGNIVLTDHEYSIVSLLRVYTDAESHHYATREKYAVDRARQRTPVSLEGIENLLRSCKKKEQLRKAILPCIDFGGSFLEHCLSRVGLDPEMKVSGPSFVETIRDELVQLVDQLATGDAIIEEMQKNGPKGYISMLVVDRATDGEGINKMFDFNPYPFAQSASFLTKTFDSFTEAVDEYFSLIGSQKLELQHVEKENEAMRRVNKIKTDQAFRLQELSEKQLADKIKADLIMNNAPIVEQALKIVRSFIAAQMSWACIQDTIEAAKKKDDPIASLITKTKFEINTISMLLSDPFAESDVEGDRVEVDLDLSLSAHANAERYYDHKKHAAVKEKRTLESQKKALKSAEKKAREVLKTVNSQKAITVARKVFWFEKFFWFISSDNFLVIGGRDQKQNELIVKRYMKTGDLYVHADVSGASSVVIKNPEGTAVPPRTIDEAGHMAVCYSVVLFIRVPDTQYGSIVGGFLVACHMSGIEEQAWETKVLCRAWWVYAHQVSKSAPTGEYLTTGSFIIRGQKNYILPTHLQLGFSFLFKIDESCVFRHADERKARILQTELPPAGSVPEEVEEEEEELEVGEDEGSGSSHERDEEQLQAVMEKAEGKGSGDEEGDPDDVSTATGLERVADKSELDSDSAETTEAETEREADKTDLYSVSTERTEAEVKEERDQTELPPDSCETTLHASSPVSLSNTLSPASSPGRSSLSPKKVPTSQQSFTSLQSDSQGLRTEIEPSTPDLRPHLEALTSSTSETKVEKTDRKKKDSVKKKDEVKPKRGQKSKLKKIKDKYRDQDEEEKELRMAILQSAGVPKKGDKKSSKSGSSGSGGGQASRGPPKKPDGGGPSRGGGEKGEEMEEREVQTELDMLPLLTGQPHPEDELHYALPIIAPYSALLNHKFKMKLVPGMSKRGKAARTALEHFSRWKECRRTERDLLRAVPDQLLSRNFPGKVKLLSIQDKKK